ncbi:MAG: hypothetical protein ACRDZ4_21300 [Egibacteraceae bacterium]
MPLRCVVLAQCPQDPQDTVQVAVLAGHPGQVEQAAGGGRTSRGVTHVTWQVRRAEVPERHGVGWQVREEPVGDLAGGAHEPLGLGVPMGG